MKRAVSRKQPEQSVPEMNRARLLTPEHLRKYPKARLMGYARVSTDEQSIDMQVTRLIEAGVKPRDDNTGYMGDLFCDTISASSAKRPNFHLLQKQIWPGDILVVYSLSRLFRDAREQLNFFDWCKRQDIKIVSLTEGVDLDTVAGKTMATMLAAFAEAERSTLRERTRHGMAERMRQGVMMGRPILVTPEKIKTILAMRKRHSVAEISQRVKLSKSAIYNVLKQAA